MRADNDGEGGIIALLGLASAAVVDPTRAVRVRDPSKVNSQPSRFVRFLERSGLGHEEPFQA
jgi:hypothetical protein